MTKDANRKMASHSDSSTSKEAQTKHLSIPSWFKVAAVAAVSAFAGGLAAAWWHRKTLTKLRESEENPQNPDFGISEADRSDRYCPNRALPDDETGW
jgi:hypothetical protein